MKYSFWLLVVFCAFSACGDDDDSSRPINPDIMEATYNYNFGEIEREAFPVLFDYVEAYEHTMDPTVYDCGDTYRLDRFHLALIVHDDVAGNVPAAFLFRPAGSPANAVGEPVPTTSPAADGANWYRQSDSGLSRRMVSALQTSLSRFAPYSEDGVDYLVIRFDRQWLRELTRASRTRWAAFFVHEGFHMFPQREMPRPNNRQSGIRSNPPADYPADPQSFSLIAAGIQLNENLLYGDDPVDWQRTLAMQYVLFDRLLAADTTGQEYIDGFYLYYAWVEGGAEFVDEKITLGAGIYDLADANTRIQVSYDNFREQVQRTIQTGNSTVIVNGVRQERRYQAVVGRSFYQIGAATFRILEGLGEAPLVEMARGQNPYQLLDDYIRANNVVIDETVALEDLKALIDWEESLELMEEYIDVFE